MSEIKRYDIAVQGFRLSGDGQWMKFIDHAQTLAAKDARIRELEEELKTQRASIIALFADAHGECTCGQRWEAGTHTLHCDVTMRNMENQWRRWARNTIEEAARAVRENT